MKQLFLTLVFLISIVFNSFSQNDDAGNLIYPNNFNITSHAVISGYIPYTNTFSFLLKGSFGITVSEIYKPYFSEIKTTLVLISYGSEKDLSFPGPSFTKSDFITNGYTYNFSKIKNFSIDLSGRYLSNYVLQLQYEYYFNPAVNLPNQTTAGWAPTVTHGIPSYVHSKTYSFSYEEPPTIFSGPESICDEANYTILNPGDMSLENANGIATLTVLANKEWKIKRIGQGSGIINLKSIRGNKTYIKKISIGAVKPGISVGTSAMYGGESRTFTVMSTDANSTLNVSLDGGKIAKLVKLSGSTYEIVTQPFSVNSNDYKLRIKATQVNSCGTSEEVIKEIILKGSQSSGGGGGGKIQ